MRPFLINLANNRDLDKEKKIILYPWVENGRRIGEL